MPKRVEALVNPEVSLDLRSTVPLYRQVYERLRAQILAGQLEAGRRLPSTRSLAATLGISRSTTSLAYEILLQEGYIESRVGDGTRVAHLHEESRRSPLSSDQSPKSDSAGQELSHHGRLLAELPYPEQIALAGAGPEENPFRISQPDVTEFPYSTWARLVARHARHSLPRYAHYQLSIGCVALREAIAAHIGVARGVNCTPDQVIITAGSQEALALVARLLLNPGDPVWLEDPGYTGARGALLATGARLVPVPVDREGLDVAVGRELCERARMVIVTPSHQFPTCVTMSLRRRLALLEWAREANAWIVEDDYDSEYRFGGRPLEALYGLADPGRAFYIGTFSKVLFPSLRLGYLVVPPSLLPAMLAARRFSDIHRPILEQLALADFMVDGHFARYLRHLRPRYQARRDALVEALQNEFGDWLDVVVPQAGLNLAAWFPAGVPGEAVDECITNHGLFLPRLSQFSLNPRALERDGWLFGFASTPPEMLRSAVHRLAKAVRTTI